jgi:hypothetical protein
LKYRFKYQNISLSITTHSQWWRKTTNPIDGDAFVLNYIDRLPSNISGGKVSLEVHIDVEVYSSKTKPFTIDCVDVMPLHQTQNLELGLAVTSDSSQIVAVNGQLCSSHANLSGEL